MGVVGPTLPVETALQAPQPGLVGFDLRAKRLQEGGLRANYGNGRRTYVQTDPAGSEEMFLFAVGLTLVDQLNHKPVTPLVFAPNDAGILDRTGQAVGDDPVIRRNNGLEVQTGPLDVVGAPADTRLVTLGFNRVHLVVALEARPATLAQKIIVDRPVGSCGDGLQADRVQVVADPAVIELGDVGMEAEFTEAVSFPTTLKALVRALAWAEPVGPRGGLRAA